MFSRKLVPFSGAAPVLADHGGGGGLSCRPRLGGGGWIPYLPPHPHSLLHPVRHRAPLPHHRTTPTLATFLHGAPPPSIPTMSFHNLMAVFSRAVDSDELERDAAIEAARNTPPKFHIKNKSEDYAEDEAHFGKSISPRPLSAASIWALIFQAARNRSSVEGLNFPTKSGCYAEDEAHFGKPVFIQYSLCCVDLGADLSSPASRPLGGGLTIYPVEFRWPSGWTAPNAIRGWGADVRSGPDLRAPLVLGACPFYSGGLPSAPPPPFFHGGPSSRGLPGLS